MMCSVNKYEIKLYYLFWSFIVFWSLYQLFTAQTDIFTKDTYLRLSLRDLSAGWSFLNRDKDVSDIEWNCFKYYVQKSWLYLIFQCFVSEVLRQWNTSATKIWYILSSMFFITVYMGFVHLLMALVQPVVFYIIILCGGKRISTWITSLMLLLSYNSLKYKYYFWQFLDDGSSYEEKIFLLLFSMAWIELRCISYCLDYVERHEKIITVGKKNHRENAMQTFINMFSYVLYLPVLYLGPIIMYEDFKNGFEWKSEKFRTRLKTFAVDIFLYTTYGFLLEFALHFFYFNAMHSDMKLIKQLPAIALAGGGLWMGFEFHTKYVITYGTATAFARLDNIEPPPTPRCIARIHIYSNMWRYFDVGLYKFLLKYIYKPCYATLCQYMNLSRLLYKLIASFSTFAFIFLWHGTAFNIFIWSVLNFIGITLEQSARFLSNTEWYKKFKDNVLKTDAMEVRFIACLCAPLLAASAISNFYLFGGAEVGHAYVALLEWPAPHNLMLVLFSTYCCCHVSMSLIDVSSRTDRRSRNKVEYLS